jgi:hypothetical protein
MLPFINKRIHFNALLKSPIVLIVVLMSLLCSSLAQKDSETKINPIVRQFEDKFKYSVCATLLPDKGKRCEDKYKSGLDDTSDVKK